MKVPGYVFPISGFVADLIQTELEKYLARHYHARKRAHHCRIGWGSGPHCLASPAHDSPNPPCMAPAKPGGKSANRNSKYEGDRIALTVNDLQHNRLLLDHAVQIAPSALGKTPSRTASQITISRHPAVILILERKQAQWTRRLSQSISQTNPEHSLILIRTKSMNSRFQNHLQASQNFPETAV